VKNSGLFYFNSTELSRPEVVHYENRLRERYSPPEDALVLLLVPQTKLKPFHKAEEFKEIRRTLQSLGENASASVHVCCYAAPFGAIPMELDEVYPLSQHETVLPLDRETVDHVANQVAEYIKRTHYASVVLLNDPKNWNNTVEKFCKKACQKKNVTFDSLTVKAQDRKDFSTRLKMILKKRLSE
jgi:predicted RNA-binding protein